MCNSELLPLRKLGNEILSSFPKLELDFEPDSLAIRFHAQEIWISHDKDVSSYRISGINPNGRWLMKPKSFNEFEDLRNELLKLLKTINDQTRVNKTNS